MIGSTKFQITEPSHIGEARRFAQYLAHGTLDFNEVVAGKLALLTNELGTNLVKYGAEGELMFRTLSSGPLRGIELLAVDKGPGMTNLGECLRDGYSTAGSPGTGLGAVQRLSQFFDIHSQPGKGTAVLAQLWANEKAPPAPKTIMGAVSIALKGETTCGDGWALKDSPALCQIVVVDGLGHGPGAAEASDEAIRIFESRPELSPGVIIQEAHAALRKTRGAAMAVARLDTTTRQIYFAGVGNISASVISPEVKSQSLISHNGTVGSEMRKVQELAYAFPKGALLVMHSDGLSARWQLSQYPGLPARHPSLIAGVLYRDFKRPTDDSTVVVLKEGRA